VHLTAPVSRPIVAVDLILDPATGSLREHGLARNVFSKAI
jgi:hypothetical protein